MEQHSAPGGYLFSHLLTRDAAYRALLDRSRALLHSAAADALESAVVEGAPDELSRLSVLLFHLESAGRWLDAHRCCCRALRSRAMQGHTDGWEDLARQAGALWERARAANPALAPQSADELSAWSFYLTLTGHTAEARDKARQALELARAAGNRVQESAALNYYGIACQHSAEFHSALDYFSQALAIYRELGQPRDILRGLNNVGLAMLRLSRLEEGLAHLRESLAIARQLYDMLMMGNLELNLGLALEMCGQTDEARSHLERSLEISRGMGDLQTEAATLASLCEQGRKAGDYAAAAELGRAALDIAERIAMPTMAVYCLIELSQIDSLSGRHAAARDLIRRAIALALDCGDRGQELEAYFAQARIEQAAGDRAAASAALDQAQACAAASGLDQISGYSEQLAAARNALAGEREG